MSKVHAIETHTIGAIHVSLNGKLIFEVANHLSEANFKSNNRNNKNYKQKNGLLTKKDMFLTSKLHIHLLKNTSYNTDEQNFIKKI